MGAHLMARRTMAERKRRAAARADRRGVLAHLLSRSDRGVITDAERGLLRAHVEAELREADELRRTVAGQQTLVQRQARQLAAAHDAIREAEQHAADLAEQLRAYRAVEEQRQADRVTRRPSLAEWWTATAAERRATHIRAFLDEQTAHLDTPTPEQP
ncbi:hypothetical protein [Streptomyces sp. DT171]|uniref:hypothetical protein n=1 Tax=Streptomyces sp. DT171 TaxID=3416524 RepID=UPI003CF8A4CA